MKHSLKSIFTKRNENKPPADLRRKKSAAISEICGNYFQMKNISIIFLILFFAFDCTAQLSQNITLLYHWDDTSLAGSSMYDNTYNEVYGFTINNREYAVIGSTAGTHIFDITDISNVDTIGLIPGAAQGTNIIHRDFRFYKGYLYGVCDEGSSTLQIIDLQYLPDSIKLVYNSDSLFANAHNAYIDTATAKIYVFSVRKKSGSFNAMEIYSLTNPLAPSLLYIYNDVATVHDGYIRNDTAYLNAANEGVRIIDYTNIASPKLLASITAYPEQGYNHSGWLTDNGKYYVFADETKGSDLKLYDVSNFSNVSFVSMFNSGFDQTFTMPHNPVIRGNYVFCSYYHDGVVIFDISNPANPVRRGFYDTFPDSGYDSYKGNWGVWPFLPSKKVLASDMQTGLYVFDFSDTTGIDNNFSDVSKFLVYPTPSSDKVYISYKNSHYLEKLSYEVYTIQGIKIVQKKNLTFENELAIIDNVKNWGSGIFIMKLFSEKNQKIIKLTIIN